MPDIQPTYLTLAQLLHRRLFEIPGYQRAYSWTSRERQDLFNDIENIFLKGPSENHFMATIVCRRVGEEMLGTDVYYKLDIVDGQQRLTTIILLLNAIKLRMSADQPKPRSKQERVLDEISELLVKVEGDSLLLLKTNHDRSRYFSNFLRDGKADTPDKGTTLADKELLTAIRECRNFVDRWTNENRDILDLFACIKNRLFFILHEVSEEKLVYTVFEILNSRGMEVSWLDRLKSTLMGKAFDLENQDSGRLIEDLHNIWEKIYAQIGLHQGLSTEALRFAATLYQSSMSYRPLSERDAVDEFRLKARDARSIRGIAGWLLEVTEACDKVISNPRQNAVTRISQARLLAVAIHLKDNIDESGREKLLSSWEKISFRIYGMRGCDARHKVGDYVSLAWRIVNEDLSVKGIRSEIKSIGKEFPVSETVKYLQEQNCYEGWQYELRYFMFRYEEHLTQEEGIKVENEHWKKIWTASPSKSIEHIIPQSRASDKIKHVLGNLMILPPDLNAKLRDKLPEQKLGAYRKTGLLSAEKVASEAQWSEETVREREEELLQWAAEEWAD